MNTATQRLLLAPPAPPGQGRAWLLALLAHGLLLAALTWGVAWQHESKPVVAEAELWSRVPQAAAPREQAAPTPPQVTPSPPQTRPAPVAPPTQPDIATQRARERAQQLERERALAQQAQQRAAQERAAQQRAEQEAQRQRQQSAQQTQRSQQQADARRQEQMREENLRRIAGLAGASGSASATGNAQQSSGPSATYAGRVVARIRPNIIFTDNLPGNPLAEVEVRSSPDGTILSRRIIRGSGNLAWDEEVLRAIDRTAVLPRDTDGRVPSPMVIGFRQRD